MKWLTKWFRGKTQARRTPIQNSRPFRPTIEALEERQLLSASAVSNFGNVSVQFNLRDDGHLLQIIGQVQTDIGSGVQGLYQGKNSSGQDVAYRRQNGELYQYTGAGWVDLSGLGATDTVAVDKSGAVFFTGGSLLIQATGAGVGGPYGSTVLTSSVQGLYQGKDAAGQPAVYDLETNGLLEVYTPYTAGGQGGWTHLYQYVRSFTVDASGNVTPQYDAIGQEWHALQAAGTNLGAPQGGEQSAYGGRIAYFQNGAIFSPDGQQTFAITGNIYAEWQQYVYTLGTPVANDQSAYDGGHYQVFQNGAIYAAANGTPRVTFGGSPGFELNIGSVIPPAVGELGAKVLQAGVNVLGATVDLTVKDLQALGAGNVHQIGKQLFDNQAHYNREVWDDSIRPFVQMRLNQYVETTSAAVAQDVYEEDYPGVTGAPVYYINGAGTDLTNAQGEALALSKQLNRPVRLLYVPTSGDLVQDLSTAAVQDKFWDPVFGSAANDITRKVAGLLYEAALSGQNLSVVAHSRGTLIMRNAVRILEVLGYQDWTSTDLRWVATGSPLGSNQSIGHANETTFITNPNDPVTLSRLDASSLRYLQTLGPLSAHAFRTSYVGQITNEMLWPAFQPPTIPPVGTLVINTSANVPTTIALPPPTTQNPPIVVNSPVGSTTIPLPGTLAIDPNPNIVFNWNESLV